MVSDGLGVVESLGGPLNFNLLLHNLHQDVVMRVEGEVGVAHAGEGLGLEGLHAVVELLDLVVAVVVAMRPRAPRTTSITIVTTCTFIFLTGVVCYPRSMSVLRMFGHFFSRAGFDLKLLFENYTTLLCRLKEFENVVWREIHCEL